MKMQNKLMNIIEQIQFYMCKMYNLWLLEEPVTHTYFKEVINIPQWDN